MRACLRSEAYSNTFRALLLERPCFPKSILHIGESSACLSWTASRSIKWDFFNSTGTERSRKDTTVVSHWGPHEPHPPRKTCIPTMTIILPRGCCSCSPQWDDSCPSAILAGIKGCLYKHKRLALAEKSVLQVKLCPRTEGKKARILHFLSGDFDDTWWIYIHIRRVLLQVGPARSMASAYHPSNLTWLLLFITPTLLTGSNVLANWSDKCIRTRPSSICTLTWSLKAVVPAIRNSV